MSDELKGALEFRDVVGFPGYRVDSAGNVWSCRKPGFGYGRVKPWKKLKAAPDTAGRPCVTLRKDGKSYHKIIAHLVAEAFIGPRPEGLLVCHDNGDQTCNRSGNLKYGTHKDNEADKARHGRKLTGDKHPVAKLTAGKVRVIKKELARDNSHGIIARLARKNHIDEAVIARIRDGIAWKWVQV